jgi:hypothetical protein
MGERGVSTFAADKAQGEEFQDFVRRCLWRDGLAVDFYASRRYQVSEGEGPSGLEVKLDRRLRETGNVYVEFAADRSRRGQFEPSGIERDERIWLWAIGDFDRFAVVQKSVLRSLRASGEYREAGDVPTKGFLLPWVILEQWAGKVFHRGALKVVEAYECSRCRRLVPEIDGGLLCPECAHREEASHA